MLAALKAVIEEQGLFCSLYVDKASHFVTTRTGHSPHRPQQTREPTQIERACRQLGIELIPAHSPQARGRMERLWETWQGRRPQELRLAGITTLEAANRFLRDTWLPFHHQTWTVPAAGDGTAFVPYTGGQLERICALQHERVVSHDNCVEFEKRRLQIPKASWRYRFAKCRVTVSHHLDGTLSVGYGPHTLGWYRGHGASAGASGPPPSGSGRVTPAPAPGRSRGRSARRGRRAKKENRTDHLLQKPDILTSYRQHHVMTGCNRGKAWLVGLRIAVICSVGRGGIR
jgi:hypothetical protein